MMEAVPDSDGGKGDAAGAGDSQESPSGTLTPSLGGSGLWLDPDQMLSPIAMVDLVNDNLTTINKLLAGSSTTINGLPAGSTADAILGMVAPFMMNSGIFGDMAIESAWSAFHQAWVRETGVTSSAITELRKLLPDAVEKYEGTDLDGGRVVSGVDISKLGSGIYPSDPSPITTDPTNSSGSGAELNGTTQSP